MHTHFNPGESQCRALWQKQDNPATDARQIKGRSRVRKMLLWKLRNSWDDKGGQVEGRKEGEEDRSQVRDKSQSEQRTGVGQYSQHMLLTLHCSTHHTHARTHAQTLKHTHTRFTWTGTQQRHQTNQSANVNISRENEGLFVCVCVFLY